MFIDPPATEEASANGPPRSLLHRLVKKGLAGAIAGALAGALVGSLFRAMDQVIVAAALTGAIVEMAFLAFPGEKSLVRTLGKAIVCALVGGVFGAMMEWSPGPKPIAGGESAIDWNVFTRALPSLSTGPLIGMLAGTVIAALVLLVDAVGESMGESEVREVLKGKPPDEE